MTTRWSPSVTVAAVIADGGAVPRFLLVEEQTPEGLRLNNPAGHLEPGETPLEGVVREALEETARTFVPEALLGLYLSRFQRPARAGPQPRAAEDVTYLRIAYRGRVGEPLPGRPLDREIVRTLWLTADEIRAAQARHRSPLVMRCIDDHLAGRALPLDAIQADASIASPWFLG
jgi:8-oxo-dGTP pyrophosphatase MutT (NUDIX family)